MRAHEQPMWAILTRVAQDIFQAQFTRHQATTSPMENSGQAMICAPALLALE
jgi:hypothetical protein